MTPLLKNFIDKWREEVDHSLDHFLPPEYTEPKTLHKAMRYSIFAGGKRLRPVLVVAASQTCGMKGKEVLPTACAMELIHTYSLIHDDLPAMDDDDLRRGRPTNHKVFGEGIAILAGDALLTYAFDLIAKNGRMLGPKCSLDAVVQTVAQGAGLKGMVSGQVFDLEMGEGTWLKEKRKRQIEILETIHKNKTAALIQASIQAGALLACADRKELKNLSAYGEKIGVAFQIADDVLDLVGNKKLLGKKGSDLENKKLTYPAIYGIEKSKETAEGLIQEAKKRLKSFGAKAQVLNDLADYIIERTY